jgi:hypothetical protein
VAFGARRETADDGQGLPYGALVQVHRDAEPADDGGFTSRKAPSGKLETRHHVKLGHDYRRHHPQRALRLGGVAAIGGRLWAAGIYDDDGSELPLIEHR